MAAVFTPKIALTLVLGCVMAGVTFQLGNWQTHRAQEKMDLHAQQMQALAAAPITPTTAQVDVQALAYRKVQLKGRYLPELRLYIDNRQVNGRPAVMAVQAFQPEGKDFVIPVDRGYLLRNPANPRQPPAWPGEPVGTVELQATLLPRFAQAAELRGFGLGQAKDAIYMEQVGAEWVWSNFSETEFQKRSTSPVSNYVLTVQPFLPDNDQATRAPTQQQGFYLTAVALPEQVAKHKGYAFQWYTLTVVLLLLTGVLTARDALSKPKPPINH